MITRQSVRITLSTKQIKETEMKILPLVTVAASLLLAPVAFAQTPPANKADCEKAKMKWDAKGGKGAEGACVTAPTDMAPTTPKK